MITQRALVLTNGTVITMWRDRPRAGEVLIADGRFAAVDRRVDRPAGAAVFDLAGRTLLPGFIDSHVHLVGLGLARRAVDLAGETSLASALDRVGRRAAAMPPGVLLHAPGFDESEWTERRMPTRADLDRVAPDRPVVAVRVCGHVAVVNSRALATIRTSTGLDDAALSAAGADVEAGTLPHGTSSYAQALAEAGDDERLEALAEACGLALARGITTVHDLSDDARLYAGLRATGRLPLRAYVADHPAEGAPPADVPRSPVAAAADDRLWTGPVKLFADGSLGARTAALHEPYADRPDSTGTLYTPPDRLAAQMEAAHRAGRQIACHAIGDRGVDTAVAAFARALRAGSRRDHRHRVEHCELLRAATLERMKALGLVASIQPNFAGRWGRPGGLYEARIGPRAAACNPLRAILSAGVAMPFGSDGMPMDALYGVWSAVTHPVPAERLTALEALWCSTAAGAHAAFAEGRLGRIAPGFLADAVLLDADPTAVEPDAIRDIQVAATLVGGEVRFGAL